MKNKQSILITIFSVVIVIILGIGLYIYNSEPTYSATDILDAAVLGADFSAEGQSVELKKIDTKAEEMFIPIKLTDETQQELIKAFEKSKFKKVDSGITKDYLMKITLNRGYVMYLDINKKGITVDDGYSSNYLFKDDKGFFSILEKVVAE